MLIKLLFAVLLVGGYYWLKFWLRSLDKDARKDAIWKIAVWLFVGVMVVAVFTGRMHWLGLAFAAVLGILKFAVTSAIRFSPMISAFAKRGQFSTPTFSTRFLKLKMNMGTMNLEGEVIDGPHKGKRLEELNKEELLELATFYKDNCKSSYYLILVALQKSGSGQATGEQVSFNDAGGLGINDAMDVLGIKEKYTREDVIQAHRRLIQKLHPDKGGSDYLASRVNLAKTVLLDSLKEN